MMKCLLAWRLKWSCSSTFLCLNALTIVLECWDDREIRGMCTWMLKYSYACTLSWSRTCMFTCFADNLQSFDFPLMIICSYVYLLKWSHAPMLTFFDVHMLRWSYAMSTRFNNHLPTYMYAIILIQLDALMITCSYIQIIWWLHAHIHWYSHVWYPHTNAHMMIMKCL